ncbi:MAG TPA: ATP-binding protein [Rugosimonospora sp.]
MSRPDDPLPPAAVPAPRRWTSTRTIAVIVFALGGLPALFTTGAVQRWSVVGYALALFTLVILRPGASAVPRRRPVAQRHRAARPYLVPRDLPPASSLFVGRDAELAAILAHLRMGRVDGPDAGESDGPRLILLYGEDGIGKTTLAVKVAHLAADLFPEGQLFAKVGTGAAGTVDADRISADAHRIGAEAVNAATADDETGGANDDTANDGNTNDDGNDDGNDDATIRATLTHFVDALQPPAQRAPFGPDDPRHDDLRHDELRQDDPRHDDLRHDESRHDELLHDDLRHDDLRERFAALTADRAVLFVLDDAASARLVQPLLTAGPRCAVLVTAPAVLPGLPATALTIRLGPLGGGESLTLLGAILGQQRIRGQREDADEIVRVTQGHPLSLRAAAAGLAAIPHARLATALRRLGAPRAPGHQARAAALDLSYALLTEQERSAVRALGLLPAPAFTPWMLAALLEVDERTATRIADRLGFAGFVDRTSVDSVGVPEFVVPEFVHRLARARLAEATSPEQRVALRERLNSRAWQRRRADPARALRDDVFGSLERGALRTAIEAARKAVAVAREKRDRTDEGLALAAFAEVRAELGNFEAADDLARAALAPAVVSAAAAARARRCLGRLYRRAHQAEAAKDELNRAYLEADGDPAEQIQALRELAVAQAQHAEAQAAEATMRAATDLYERHPEVGERYRAGVSWASSVVLESQGRFDDSQRAIDSGLEYARAHGQQLWLAWLTYRAAGLEMARAVDFEAVRTYGNEAIRLFSDMNHRYGKAHCRLVIGHAYLLEKGMDEAATLLEEALENFINCGDRWAEAEACQLLALARHPEDPTPEAARLLRTAGRIFEDLGDAGKAKEVYERLARLPAPDGRRS